MRLNKMSRFEKYFRLILSVFMILQLGMTSAAAVAQPVVPNVPVYGPKFNIHFITMNQLEDVLAQQLESAETSVQGQSDENVLLVGPEEPTPTPIVEIEEEKEDAEDLEEEEIEDEDIDDLDEDLEEEETEEPEVEETEELEEEETEEPEVEETEDSEEEETEEPEEEETEDSEEEETEEPEEEEIEEPEEEEIEESEEEEIEESEEEEIEEPEEEEIEKSEEEEIEEPEEEEIEESEEEEIEEPEEEEIEEPEEEEIEEPEEEEIEEPEAEVTEDPEVEVTEDPEAEVTEDPEAEVTEDPEVEVTGDPEVEVTEDPEVEVTEDPEVEVTEDPEAEVTEDPEVEVTEDPEVEVTEDPEAEETAAPEAEETVAPEGTKPVVLKAEVIVEPAKAEETVDGSLSGNADACEGGDCALELSAEITDGGTDLPKETEPVTGVETPTAEPEKPADVATPKKAGNVEMSTILSADLLKDEGFENVDLAGADAVAGYKCTEEVCYDLGDPDKKIQIEGENLPEDWGILIDNNGVYHVTYTIPDYDEIGMDAPDIITIDLKKIFETMSGDYSVTTSSNWLQPGDSRVVQVWIQTESGYTYKYVDGSFKLSTPDQTGPATDGEYYPLTDYVGFDGQQLNDYYTKRTSLDVSWTVQPLWEYYVKNAPEISTNIPMGDPLRMAADHRSAFMSVLNNLRNDYEADSVQEALELYLVDYYNEKDEMPEDDKYTSLSDVLARSSAAQQEVIPAQLAYGDGSLSVYTAELPLEPEALYNNFYNQVFRFVYGEGYTYDADGNPIPSDQDGIQDDVHEALGDPGSSQVTVKHTYDIIDYDDMTEYTNVVPLNTLPLEVQDFYIGYYGVPDDLLCLNQPPSYPCGFLTADGELATASNSEAFISGTFVTSQQEYNPEWFDPTDFKGQAWLDSLNRIHAEDEIYYMSAEEKAALYEEAGESGREIVFDKFKCGENVCESEEELLNNLSGEAYLLENNTVVVKTLTGLDYLQYQVGLMKFIEQYGEEYTEKLLNLPANNYNRRDAVRKINSYGSSELQNYGDDVTLESIYKAYGVADYKNNFMPDRPWYVTDGTVGEFMENRKNWEETGEIDENTVWGRTNAMFKTLLGEGITADEAAMASFMFAANIDGLMAGNVYQDTGWGWDSEIKLEKVYDSLTINKVDAETHEIIGAASAEESDGSETSAESSEEDPGQTTFQVWYYKENKANNTMDKYYYTMITDDETGKSAPGFAKYDPARTDLSYTIDTTDGKLEMTYPRIAGAVYYLREVNAPHGYVTDTTVRIICDTEEKAEAARQRLLNDAQIQGDEDDEMHISKINIVNAQMINPVLLKTENASRVYEMDFENSKPTDTPTPEPTNTPEPTLTYTPEPTDTPEPTSTYTPEPTDTPEPTSTYTPVPTSTPEPTSTYTPVPTNTPEPTSTYTPVPTNTPAPTATNTPVPTATSTATPIPGGFEPTDEPEDTPIPFIPYTPVPTQPVITPALTATVVLPTVVSTVVTVMPETPKETVTPEPERSYPTRPEWNPDPEEFPELFPEIPPRREYVLLDINDYRVPLAGLVNMNEGDCFD